MVLENVNTSQRVILWCLYLQDLTFSCSYSHCCSWEFQINMDLFDNCFNQHYFDLSFNVKKILINFSFSCSHFFGSEGFGQ